ncbi:MAG: OPT/YSL family transporter [Gammaproteobacteria bacterium]
MSESTAATRELTVRALATGLALGIVLTPANVYSGLRIGWSFNMSIIALLVGFGLWRTVNACGRGPRWTLHESNITQTAASSAASIVSGGLVAPIPAWLLLTGNSAHGPSLAVWVFSVSFLGVWVAWYLRPALIVRSSLPFPVGLATHETLRDVFAHGRAAGRRLAVLAATAVGSAGVKLGDDLLGLPRWAPTPALERYTFALEPSPLLLGFGAIIGLRTGLSLLLGAVLAWGVAAPLLVETGIVSVRDGGAAANFGPLVEWLLWPGVSAMISATLVSFAAGLVRLYSRRGALHGGSMRRPGAAPAAAFAAAALLAVTTQVVIFDIDPWLAALAVPFAVALAVVAARVVGETGIPPIGAIGKVSQLGFGVLAPGTPLTNLMTANVAGGAAGQCADLLNDFKVGHAIGARPGHQAIAQCCGIVAGSVVGTAAFIVLIPDPHGMLLTAEWPAPAVATWKAVAEVLAAGLDSVPVSARTAMLAGAAVGIGLGLVGELGPARAAACLPSAVALGLAFVVPASVSLVMAAGAILAWAVNAGHRRLADGTLLAAAAGMVAGESTAGVAVALTDLLR